MTDLLRSKLFLPNLSPTDVRAGDEIVWFPDEKKIELVRPDPAGGKAVVLGMQDDEGQVRPCSEVFRKAAPAGAYEIITPEQFQIGAEFVLGFIGTNLKPVRHSRPAPEGLCVFRLE